MKWFFYFFWGFLALLACIVIPDALATKKYLSLGIFLFIAAALSGLMLFLYRIFFANAKGFSLTEGEIFFSTKPARRCFRRRRCKRS